MRDNVGRQLRAALLALVIIKLFVGRCWPSDVIRNLAWASSLTSGGHGAHATRASAFARRRPDSARRASTNGGLSDPSSFSLPPHGVDVLEGLLGPTEAESVVNVARSLHSSFCADIDSVDSHPSFELPIISRGEWNAAAGPLREILEKPLQNLQERINGLRRRGNNTEHVVVSQALVRRYAAGERRSHPVHYDHHALVTAVCSLTSPQSGSGLFVQPNAHAMSREFVELHAAGNFLVHNWKLLHGVDVRGDEERFSLIVWFKPSCEVACGGTSWYDALAVAGDPDAQFRLGMRCEHGGNDAEAREWFLLASEQAKHWPSMYRLGVLLRRKNYMQAAASWLRGAAQAGFSEAQVDLGDLLCGWGWGEVERTERCEPSSEAARLYEAAAAQGSPAGQQRVARIRFQEGANEAAEILLRAAAVQGLAVAQSDLGYHLMAGGFEEEAITWFERADGRKPCPF